MLAGKQSLTSWYENNPELLKYLIFLDKNAVELQCQNINEQNILLAIEIDFYGIEFSKIYESHATSLLVATKISNISKLYKY